MNRLRSIQVEQLPQTVLRRPTANHTTSNNLQVDDDAFGSNTTVDDQQAHIRRRAPTRHSIKSLTGRKTPLKQNPSNEVNIHRSIDYILQLYNGEREREI